MINKNFKFNLKLLLIIFIILFLVVIFYLIKLIEIYKKDFFELKKYKKRHFYFFV